jgi:hypothetical protein
VSGVLLRPSASASLAEWSYKILPFPIMELAMSDDEGYALLMTGGSDIIPVIVSTLDEGDSWHPVSLPVNSLGAYTRRMTMTPDSQVLVLARIGKVCCVGDTNEGLRAAVVSSSNQTVTWSAMDFLPDDGGASFISATSKASVAISGRFLHRKRAGGGWSKLPNVFGTGAGRDWGKIQVLPNEELAAIAVFGGFVRFNVTDQAAVVVPNSTFGGDWLINLYFLNAKEGFVAGMLHKGLWRTNDGGSTWGKLNVPAEVCGTIAFSSPESGVYVGDARRLYVTGDGGKKWNLVHEF